MILCYPIAAIVTAMNILISALYLAAKAAATVTLDLDESIPSSHSEKNRNLLFEICYSFVC